MSYNPLTFRASMVGGSGSMRFSFSTATTQSATASPAILRRLHIPGLGGTVGAITIYDNNLGDTSGTVVYGPTTVQSGDLIDIQAPCTSGISIQTAAATVGFLSFDPS